MAEMISDILLAVGALAAAAFCLLLSLRLKRFASLDRGVGGAIAVLSAQVEDLTRTLARAEDGAKISADLLNELTERAEKTSRQLEYMLAATQDIPVKDEPAKAEPPSTFVRHEGAGT
ncbi:MAG: hypothetical protein QGI08_10900 [Paracoccaceae bacterium]|jgi:hypothetical protein|nr:hypothetical protein [Paracoccaceae bacterium]MDP7186220.1 hypothetical protein [Paracoccaceae bacterium]